MSQTTDLLLLAGLPVAITAILYFLLHRRLGFLWIYLMSVAASWGAYILALRLTQTPSGFDNIIFAMILVGYLVYCLLIAWLCSRLMRRGAPTG